MKLILFVGLLALCVGSIQSRFLLEKIGAFLESVRDKAYNDYVKTRQRPTYYEYTRTTRPLEVRQETNGAAIQSGVQFCTTTDGQAGECVPNSECNVIDDSDIQKYPCIRYTWEICCRTEAVKVYRAQQPVPT